MIVKLIFVDLLVKLIYTLETALNELIHNSIAVMLKIFLFYIIIILIIIVDNGNGMDKNNMDKLKKF